MDIETIVDEHAIKTVIYQYCRGIDRKDFDLVRSCYHPDAIDDHGAQFTGGVDAFIEYVQREGTRFRQTMHLIANLLIEIDGDVAWSEAYAIAFHRVKPTSKKGERDFNVGFRYVDRFERRDGKWAIAKRTCVFSWMRADDSDPLEFWGESCFGGVKPADPVYDRS